jgi:hypothetical protein
VDNEYLRHLLEQARAGKQPNISKLVYTEEPATIDEFIASPKYLGFRTAWPKVVALARWAELPYIRQIEARLGKGSGKTSWAAIFLAYGVHRLLCMRNPHAYFNIDKSSKIVVINLSTAAGQAMHAVFGQLKNFVERSPWFKDRFEAKKTIIEFEKNVLALSGHSKPKMFEGFCIYRAVIDEINKMEIEQARQLHELVLGQSETRFPNDYKIALISSCGIGGKMYLDHQIDKSAKKGVRMSETEFMICKEPLIDSFL